MIPGEMFNVIRQVKLRRANLFAAARRVALSVVVAVLSLTAGARAQDSSNAPPGLPENVAFSHPMTVINQTELAVVKQRIADKIEPQAFGDPQRDSYMQRN